MTTISRSRSNRSDASDDSIASSSIMTGTMTHAEIEHMKNLFETDLHKKEQQIIAKKSEIVDKRYAESIEFNASDEKRNNEKKCCHESDTKFIMAHGEIPNNDFFHLKKGYTLIFLTAIGEKLITNRKQLDFLIELFKREDSIFKHRNIGLNHELREEIQKDFKKAGITSEYNHLKPTLFIGGDYELRGETIPVKVPNVKLTFGDKNCDNWGVSVISETTPTEIYPTCTIHCFSTYDTKKCEKYFTSEFFDQGDERKNAPLNVENRKGITLQELLNNEGPGKYILLCCLSTQDQIVIDKFNANSNLYYISTYAHIAKRTRNQIRQLLDRGDGIKRKTKARAKIEGEGESEG